MIAASKRYLTGILVNEHMSQYLRIRAEQQRFYAMFFCQVSLFIYLMKGEGTVE